MKEKIYYKNIGGTKCYVIKKKGFTEKQAMVIFKYGSKDTQFIIDNKINSTPSGTAHFLEHKLFDDKNINVFEKFSNLSASVNAFTNLNNTAYYFKCNDGFYESLKILLEMVSSPYFTDESVEKEKDIINQEIKMYDDDPYWCGYFNLLKCMYPKNAIGESIAGSVDSIKEITKETLYSCYENFYTKSNAAVVCCGDIDEYDVFESIEKNLKLNDKKDIKVVISDNNDEFRGFLENFVKRKMNIGQNIFNIGFKELEFNDKIDTIKDRISTTKILLDIIFGKSSKLYNEMYNSGLVDESFNFEYCLDFEFGFCVLSGSSNDYEKVKDLILNRIELLKKNGICEKDVIRTRKKHIGEFIRGFNNISNIVNSQSELSLKKTGLDEILSSIRKIDASKINNRLNTLFKNNLCAASLIEKEN